MGTPVLTNSDEYISQQVDYWLKASFDDATKKEIQRLQREDKKALIDAFYTNLSFGTGGLRGIMGVGPNRMNAYTVGWATQGLANYLKKCFPDDSELRVAIGYDSRNNSKEFALQSAAVLAANGIRAFVFNELRPTPLVSFACRYHHCQAAIMVTASHNPPSYNGYKVYWGDGAQVLPPHDTGIIQEVACLHDPAQIKQVALDDPLIVYMGKEVDEAYLKAIASVMHMPKQASAKEPVHILYSSLHGTGITLMLDALKQFGFTNVSTVEKQCIPDGNFPTCLRPNPEEKEALALGIAQMMQSDCDLFIATDPDADRVGVVVLHNNEPVILNGNQIAAILAYFICESMPLPEKAAFVKTIVTTELFREIVEGHAATCFDVLTGFKYIAEKIRIWQDQVDGYHYIFGGEESYGYLFGTHVRDKDAIISASLIARAAQFAKEQGKTLVDLLNQLYLQYGLYVEELVSVNFEESRAGKEAMQKIMNTFREAPPKELAGEKIVRIADLTCGIWTNSSTGTTEQIDLPVSDVLIWELEKGTKIVLRPSGTEPKMKVYLMLKEPKGFSNLEEAKAKIEAKAKQIKSELNNSGLV